MVSTEFYTWQFLFVVDIFITMLLATIICTPYKIGSFTKQRCIFKFYIFKWSSRFLINSWYVQILFRSSWNIKLRVWILTFIMAFSKLSEVFCHFWTPQIQFLTKDLWGQSLAVTKDPCMEHPYMYSNTFCPQTIETWNYHTVLVLH